MKWSLRRHLVISFLMAVAVGGPIIAYAVLTSAISLKYLVPATGLAAVLVLLHGITDYRMDSGNRDEQTKQ